MKVPQRVIWSEGMFMSPQHLQQLDRYHEQYVASRLNAMGPFDWGVVAAELDERALVAGQVRVQQFEGVLPDGLPLSFDGQHPEAPAVRPVEGFFPPMQRVLEVFLGVPIEREGMPAVAAATSPAAGMRFFTTSRVVVDAAGGATDVGVAFAQRHVVVLFGTESRDDYEAIKIAEVVRDAAGTLTVRKEYIPPVRRIAASPWLMGSLRAILGEMVSRQRNLSEKRREREGALVEFNATDITNFLKLNAINTFIPIVNHLVERHETAPEDAYLLLAQFAGQLSTFTTQGDPTTLPKFLYNDLTTTFGELAATIRRLLAIIDPEKYVTVPLTPREDGLHFGRLDDERLLRGAQYLLAVRSNQPERTAAEQIPVLSKIASWSDVGAIVQSALPGVPIQVTYRPPSEIPPRAGTLYFVLVQNNDYWRNVAGERTIAIYLPQPYDPNNIKLELLAIPKAAAAQ
jgi:type VI secretion system protein ImpJ